MNNHQEELGGSGYSSRETPNRQTQMNKKERRKYPSLRSFTWSEDSKKSEGQLLVENTVQEWYDAKHATSSIFEIEFINSLDIKQCPFCGSNDFIKYGHKKDGTQRYICKECGKRFTALTNTIFDSKKIPISEWIEYLLHLFEFHSINSTAYDNRNSPTTGKYWLIKTFEVLKGIQDDVVLDDTVYLDETYFTKVKSKLVTKDEKKLKGISRNKIGVGVACNETKSIFIVTGTSKPSRKSTIETYGKHIARGSVLVHDDEHSHSILIEELELESIVYPTKETKGLSDKDNPLYPVNNLHLLLKQFIRNHGAYDREHLQDWLNLFWFIMNEPKDKYDKVLKFIELTVLSPKKVRYRDAMSSKHSK